MIRQTSLLELVEQYMLVRDISENTVRHMQETVQLFSAHIGRPAETADLTEDNVNNFLRDYQNAGKSSHYRRGLRADLVALWNDAAAQGLCERPRRIRQVKLDPIIPDAWTSEEITRLIEAADVLKGDFRTLPESRSNYFRALIPTAWDTGLRRKDLHRLPFSRISRCGLVIQNKTRRVAQLQLRPLTLEAINQLRRNREYCFPLWGSDTSFQEAFNKIVGAARLTGPFKKIRKSAGSAAEALHSGRGHEFLGNTRRVFEQYYLDRRIPDPPLPPPLRGTG